MTTLQRYRVLVSSAPTGRCLSSVRSHVRSIAHCRPHLSHLMLVHPAQQRWNHQQPRNLAAGARPLREDVEGWYVEFGVSKAAPYSEIKRRWYKISPLYHPDAAGDDPEAKLMWQKVSSPLPSLSLGSPDLYHLPQYLDLYNNFSRIYADGTKKAIDREIMEHRAHTPRVHKAALPTKAVAEAARAKGIKEARYGHDDDLRRAVKKRDEALKQAMARQQANVATQPRAQPAAAAADRASNKTSTQNLNTGYSWNFRKTNQKTNTHPLNAQHTRTEAGANTAHKQQPDKDMKSAQSEMKQSAPAYVRRRGPGKAQPGRDSDISARSRIIYLLELPGWANLKDVCDALARFRPGAIFDCSLRGSTARIEFFHSSAARHVLRMVQSGGVILSREDKTTNILKSFKVTSAKVDMAADKDPSSPFPYRSLSFHCKNAHNPSGQVCKALSLFLQFISQHGARPRIVQYLISDGLFISFASVKDAETVLKILQKHRPDIEIHLYGDDIGSISPSSNVGRPTNSQENIEGQTGGLEPAKVSLFEYVSASLSRFLSHIVRASGAQYVHGEGDGRGAMKRRRRGPTRL